MERGESYTGWDVCNHSGWTLYKYLRSVDIGTDDTSSESYYSFTNKFKFMFLGKL